MLITTVNGEVTDKISLLDRGFLYGDSVYEVCPAYGHKLFLFEEHLARMQRNAAWLGIPEPQGGWSEIRTQIDKARQLHPDKDHYLRWILTRGVTPINLKAYDEYPSTLVIMVNDLIEAPAQAYQSGIKLKIVGTERNSKRALDPLIKSGNYLNNILALKEAHLAGYDDAIMLNPQGHISEATQANIFFVNRQQELLTPQLDTGLLDGVTRAFLMTKLFKSLKIVCREAVITPADMAGFSEAFLSSSVKGIVPVNTIDSHHLDSAKSNSLTQTIRHSYDMAKRQ
jgi:branched-chain amino acid aminotransferase